MKGARFDLLAIKWLAEQRRDGSNCSLALIEMKYGDNALDGGSGLNKHLADILKIRNNPLAYESLLNEVENVFKQLRELELIRFGRGGNSNEVRLDRVGNPEIIFLLANHNPRSKKLLRCLNSINDPAKDKEVDLRFFLASFAGYGMHSPCILKPEEFMKVLELMKPAPGTHPVAT